MKNFIHEFISQTLKEMECGPMATSIFPFRLKMKNKELIFNVWEGIRRLMNVMDESDIMEHRRS